MAICNDKATTQRYLFGVCGRTLMGKTLKKTCFVKFKMEEKKKQINTQSTPLKEGSMFWAATHSGWAGIILLSCGSIVCSYS